MNKTRAVRIGNVMQSSRICIRIWGLIPDVKKICIDQWLGKDFCILERIRSKQGVDVQFWFVLNTSGGTATPWKVCNIYSHLSLETVFPFLKLTQKCYINTHTFFLKNWPFNHKLGPLSLLLLQTYCAWKTMLTIWQSTNSRRLQTFQFFSSLVQLE